MYSERYQLFSKGRLKDGSDKKQYLEFLSIKLGIDSPKAEVLISGQNRVIKKDLNLVELKKYYKVFGESGLDVAARVVMDENSFVSALVGGSEVENLSRPKSFIKADLPEAEQVSKTDSILYVRELKKIKPVIFSGKRKVDVVGSSNNKKYLLDNNGVSIGSLMILAAVVFASLELQTYAIKLLTFNYGLSMGSTVASLFVLVMGLLCLPVLLVPLRHMEIVSDKNDIYSFKEANGINFFKNKYYLYVNSLKSGLIIRSRFSGYDASCVSESGEIEYFISRIEQSAYEQAGEESKDVSMGLADLGAMEYVDYWNNFIKIFKSYKNYKSSGEDIETADMDEFAFVYSHNNGLVAKLYLSSQLAIEYKKENLIEEDKVKILSLALLSVGVK